jgi:alkanesulfonate monooxygenase SsuD/methylene tetrahydromethanopterin reductase-like flavin-dependent oxidoreductase (luciferase family)
MKYGLHLAGGALVCGRKELKEVATVAEELDFDSILIGDHIVNAKNIESPWPSPNTTGMLLIRTDRMNCQTYRRLIG